MRGFGAAYLIIGPSASGKTTVGKELERRGFRVIHADSAFGYFADLRTLAAVDFPWKDGVTPDWYQTHGWIWNSEKVERLLSKSYRVVFCCGGALNEGDYYSRFRKVFNLTVDPDILRMRLMSRANSATNNPVWLERSLAMAESESGPDEACISIRADHGTVESTADALLAHVDDSMGEALVRNVVKVVRPVYRRLRTRVRHER